MSNLRIGRKKYYLRVVVSLLILFVVLCNEKNGPENPENILKQDTMQKELTIESAKQWFEKKVAPNSNGRIAANTKKEVLWNFATQGTDQEKDNVIIVPVAVEEKYQSFGVMMKQEDSPKIKKELESKNYRNQMFSTPQKLIMYKDSLGKVHTMRMEIVADYDYFEKSLKKVNKAKNDANDFSGSIFFYNWNETGINEGLHYKNGKLKGVYEPNKAVKNGRLAGCSTTTYTQIVPCNNAKVLVGHSCFIEWDVTNCTYDSFGGVFDVSFNSLPMFFMNGGGTYVDAISSSYRANQVDNFLSQAAQYGFQFDPDERLDFIDFFDEFLKIKDKLLNSIKKVGGSTVQWIEQKFCIVTGNCLTNSEKISLGQGVYWRYRTNLLLYLINGDEAFTIAENIFNGLNRDGSQVRQCGSCRVNSALHAAWRILDAGAFGVNKARSLGIAHEDRPAGIQLEKDMDLHNNEVGLKIFELSGSEEGNSLINLISVITNNTPTTAPYNGLKFLLKNAQDQWELKSVHDYPNEN